MLHSVGLKFRVLLSILFIFLLQLLFPSFLFAQKADLHADTLKARKYINQYEELLEEKYFQKALTKLEHAQAIYLKAGLWESYLKCQHSKANFISEIDKNLYPPLINQITDEAQKYLPPQHYLTGKAFHKKGNYFLSANQLDSALVYFEKATAIYAFNERWKNYGQAKLSLAVCFFYQSRFDSSEYHIIQLQDIADQYAIEDDGTLTNTNNLLSILYSTKGDYNQAIETVLKDIDRIKSKEQLSPYDSSSVANYYNSLAAWYTMKEDYNRALDYLMNTTFLYEKMGLDAKYLFLIYNNIAKVYSFKGEYESSITYFLKNISLVNTSSQPDEHIKVLKDSYNGMSTCFRKIHQLDSALHYAQLASHTAIEHNQKLALYSLGRTHLSLNNEDQAIRFLLQAEDIIVKEQKDKERYIINIYNGLGEAWAAKKNHQKALDYYQKALIKNCDEFTAEDWRQNPQLTSVNRPDLLLTSLHHKAKTIASLSTKKETLERSLSTYELGIDWIDSLRHNIASEESQLFWRNKVRDVYGEAIEVAYQLYSTNQQAEYFERAFAFSEKSKGILLLESRKASESKTSGAVPDSLLQKEKDLKIDVAFFQKKLRTEKEESKAKRYQEYLSDSRLQLASLKEQIERDFPEVSLNKNNIFSTSSAEVREGLLEDENVLIEYFLTNNNLYAFLISTEKEQFIRLAKSSIINQQSEAFLQQLLNPKAMNTDAQKALADYSQQSHELFQTIFSSFIPSLSESIRRIYIVPDGVLYNIPFEALTVTLKKDPSMDFGSLDYLGKRYNFSYAYSYNMLAENLHNKATLTSNQKCLATAPLYASNIDLATRSTANMTRGELARLEGTAKEIQAISQYFSGEFELGAQATKTAFLNQIEQFGILHLATHGVADYDDHSFAYFLFSPSYTTEDNDRLYHYEIANLDLNAQLAVLSACETGQGKYEEGEGVFSLARGFMQAGVPSVVMSLWKVNDLSTSELMPLFYAGLADGLPIDQALNAAKQEYLGQASLRFKHPYYWSAFITLGDPHVLTGKSYNGFYVGIGGILLLLLGWVFLKQMKKG